MSFLNQGESTSCSDSVQASQQVLNDTNVFFKNYQPNVIRDLLTTETNCVQLLQCTRVCNTKYKYSSSDLGCSATGGSIDTVLNQDLMDLSAPEISCTTDIQQNTQH